MSLAHVVLNLEQAIQEKDSWQQAVAPSKIGDRREIDRRLYEFEKIIQEQLIPMIQEAERLWRAMPDPEFDEST